MTSLAGFPQPPGPGMVTVCEKEGKMHFMPAESADITKYSPMLGSYPVIHVTREVLRPTASKESAKAAFLPSEETPLKRAMHAWYEIGMIPALEELAQGDVPSAVSWFAQKALSFFRWAQRLHTSLYPHLMMSPEALSLEFGHVRDWPSSPVRSFAWHPHSTKMAVALRDDSVHVYTLHSSLVPVLKHRQQRDVTCMAWRPLSASELAVGCREGILLWHVDPNSVVTRPSSTCVTLLTRSGHSPVSTLSWHPDGKLLVTGSALDKTMVVWEASTERSVPMTRVGGGGVSYLTWSQDGRRLLSATPSSVFRVWESHSWTHERWSTVEGHLRAACWSPCGSTLLFATANDPLIYALIFPHEDRSEGGGAKAAIPVADLALVDAGYGCLVGGSVLDMAWDPSGERLAVCFRESTLVALFRTKTSPVLQVTPCGFIQGQKDEYPVTVTFQQDYKNGALLAVVWSGGRIQYFPMLFSYGATSMGNGHLSLSGIRSPRGASGVFSPS